MSLLRSVEVVVVEEPQRLYRVSRARECERLAEAFRSSERQRTSTLRGAAMTYSIFDSTGNLIDAFDDHAAALNCLAGIAQAEPPSASQVFLIAQGEDGVVLDGALHLSSL
jgi:hypothetical protein